MLDNCAIHHGDAIRELVEEEACTYTSCFLFVHCSCFHSVQIGLSSPLLSGLQPDRGGLLQHQGLPTPLSGGSLGVFVGSCLFADRRAESVRVFSLIGIRIRGHFTYVIFCNSIYKICVNRIAFGSLFSINCLPHTPPRPIPHQEHSRRVTAPSLHQNST